MVTRNEQQHSDLDWVILVQIAISFFFCWWFLIFCEIRILLYKYWMRETFYPEMLSHVANILSIYHRSNGFQFHPTKTWFIRYQMGVYYFILLLRKNIDMRSIQQFTGKFLKLFIMLFCGICNNHYYTSWKSLEIESFSGKNSIQKLIFQSMYFQMQITESSWNNHQPGGDG